MSPPKKVNAGKSGKSAPAPTPAPAPAPVQQAQVNPAKDPSPGGANTCGKICPETSPAPKPAPVKPPEKTWRDKLGEKLVKGQLEREGMSTGEKIGKFVSPWMGGGKAGGAAAAKGAGKAGGAGKPAPAPAPAPKPAPTPAPAPAPAPTSGNPKPANGKDGLYSTGKANNEKGKCGEWLAKQDLHNEGYTDIIEVQNKSGHGVDVMGRNANGDVKVYEVKTTDTNSAPPFSKQQKSMGGKDFTDDRLGKAANGEGHYKNSPQAKENALKGKRWLEGAGENGKKVEHKKYDVYIEDPKDGCIKKKAEEKPWDKPTPANNNKPPANNKPAKIPGRRR